MKKLLRYLRHVKRVDRMRPPPRQWATEYDPAKLDQHTARLMQLTAVRSPQGVKVLERRKRASAADLAATLPVRWIPRRHSIRSLLMRIAGTTPYDPMRGEFRRRKR